MIRPLRGIFEVGERLKDVFQSISSMGIVDDGDVALGA